MFKLIILGLFVIGSVISLIVGLTSRNKADAILWIAFIALVTAFIALVTGVTLLFMSYNQVPTGYGGVVQTFGKVELTREIALTNAELKKGERKLTEITNAALDARKRGQDGCYT
jgi:hypothetical protein